MDFHFTEHNNRTLLSITNTLVKTLDLIGNKAVAKPFSEKKLLKHALLDLCKQIYANLYAVKTLLADFHDERNNLKRVPIALIIRGAIADCITGVYLITFRNSDESLKNEIDVMSRDYAKFLRFFEGEKVRYLQKFEPVKTDEELKKWEIKIEYTVDGKINFRTSTESKIILPKFDSAMTNFSVLWDDFSVEFSGNFLSYELPNLLSPDADTWYLNIDKPPFEHQNYSDTINYIMMIHTDSTQLTGIWYLN